MNVWDILLTLLLAAVFVLAVRKCVRDWRRGGCDGCSACAACADGCTGQNRAQCGQGGGGQRE